MTEDLVLRRVEHHVGVVSLNRPDRHNAINDEMGAALRTALDWAYADPEVRCVLLRGEGPSFCSGRDVSVLGHRAGGESDFIFVRNAQDRRLAQLDAPKPIVAAMRGYALGGGFEMALAADMRVASSDARMALPEINYGLLPDTGGTQLLTALAGPSRAKYLTMSGDRIDAATALSWGIVDWVVEPDELDGFAFDIAAKLAAKPPIALAMAKQLVDHAWGDTIRNGMRQELLAQTALFETEDYAEARAAHREKRKPVYKGK